MPLLSIEFAVFFIVFCPCTGHLHVCRKFKMFYFLVAGLGWLYRIDPIFAALILVYSSVVYLISVLMFSETRISANFGWVAVFQRH